MCFETFSQAILVGTHDTFSLSYFFFFLFYFFFFIFLCLFFEISMDYEIKNCQDCYNFPGLLDLLKKYKSFSAKRQHDHHHDHHHRRHRHVSPNYKIKPVDESKTTNHNHNAFEEEIFKANYYDKRRDGKHANNKGSQNGNGLQDQLNKMSHKHNNSRKNDQDNGCFKAIMSLSTPNNKKKKAPKRVSSFDPSTSQTMEPLDFGRRLSRARSFEASTPSFGRTRSINNNRNEQGMKSPSNSRTSPMLNRTTSTNSRTGSFNGRNGSFNRSGSISRSTSDTAAKVQKANLSKSGPIMFSNSSGMMKPPATEKQLELTLEELYHGGAKHIKVSRDVYTFSGQRIQEEEVLTVNIKPGWKTGTKITFPATNNDEKPGECRGDIIFVVTEKGHPLFKRIEDDLELEIGIPLVDALTGCSLYIPLLGREKMFVTIDEIVYPGYHKTFEGQGMPNQKNPHHKGDLIVKFLVDYLNDLTDEQRSEICNILSQ